MVVVVLRAAYGDWINASFHPLADKQSETGNKDGKVTLGEVKAYLDREMTYQARRRFSRDQHATVSGDLKTVLSAY